MTGTQTESMEVTMEGWARLECSALGLKGLITFTNAAPLQELAELEAWSRPCKEAEEALFGGWLATSYGAEKDSAWSWRPEMQTNSIVDGYLTARDKSVPVQLTHLSPLARGELGKQKKAENGSLSLSDLVLEAARSKSAKYGGQVEGLILGLITFVPIFPATPFNFPGSFTAVCPEAHMAALKALRFGEIWVIPPCCDGKHPMAYRCL